MILVFARGFSSKGKIVKKLKYICMFCVLSIFTASCHKNINIETSAQESLPDSYFDVTDQIEDLKAEYEILLDFGLKHGLLYSNGEQTGGIPEMAEMEPLHVGDEVVLRKQKVVSNKRSFDFTPKETDESAILSMLNNMTLDEMYDYIGGFEEFIPVGIVGEGSKTTKEATESILGYMGYNNDGDGKIGDEGLAKLSESELREHAAKVIAYGNLRYNRTKQRYKDYVEHTPEINVVEEDDYNERSEEYQSWYAENIITITKVRSRDFTQEVLPGEVVFKDGRYYLDRDAAYIDENMQLLQYRWIRK